MNLREKGKETPRWECRDCGNVYIGDTPPPCCPRCGARATNLLRIQD